MEMDVPPEILLILFKYLSHGDRMAAGQTCRLWHQVSRDISFRKKEILIFIRNYVQNYDFIHELILWNSLYNFNNYRFIKVDLENVPNEFWLRNGEFIKNIEFDHCDFHEKLFLKIINSCKCLESLHLINCKELFMGATLVDENKISRCKTLNKLSKLNLANNKYLTDALFWRLTCNIESLEELDLSDCQITFHRGLFNKFYPQNSLQNGENYPPSESILTFPYIKKFLEAKGNHINSLLFDSTLIDGNALTTISELPNIKLQKISLASCDQLNSDGIIAFTRNQTNLIHLDVSSCTRVNDEALKNICQNLPLLESLSLMKCRKLTNNGIIHITLLERLKSLDITYCPFITSDGFLNGICKTTNNVLLSLNITALEVNEAVIIAIAENFRNLRSLNMGFCKSVTDTSIQAVVENLVLLKTLILNDCTELTDAALTGMGMGIRNQESDTTSSTSVKTTPVISDEVHRISLGSRAEREIIQDAKRKNDLRQVCENYSDDIIGGFSLVRLKLLEILDLTKCNNVTDVSLIYAFHSKTLRTLRLNNCQQITREGLKHLTENCPSIERLELRDCFNICDVGVKYIAMNLKRLKTLHLQACSMLTDETVHIIKHYCKNIKEVNILSCRNICEELAATLQSLPMLQTLRMSKPGPYVSRMIPNIGGRRDF